MYRLPVPADQSSFIQPAGTLSLEGINNFIAVASHEAGHKYYYLNVINPRAGAPDTDGDGLPNAWELAHYLDPTQKDTTGSYNEMTENGAPILGDQELLADIYAMKLIEDYRDAGFSDWADDGILFGSFQPGPNFPFAPLGTDILRGPLP